MVNKQTTHRHKVKRLERELGARETDDPAGVLAVLQTARRLLAEGGVLLKDGWQEKRSRGKPDIFGVMGALRRAADLAHPKDRERAIWSAQHAIQGALEADKTAEFGMAHLDTPIITRWESHPKVSLDDALRVYDAAIKNQGRVNIAHSKAKGRK